MTRTLARALRVILFLPLQPASAAASRQSGFGSSCRTVLSSQRKLLNVAVGRSPVVAASEERIVELLSAAAGVATVNACSFSLTCDGGLLQHGAPSGPRGAAPGEVVGALADTYTLAGDSGRRETRQLCKTKTNGERRPGFVTGVGDAPSLPRGSKRD